MPKQFKEIHKQLKLNTPGHIITIDNLTTGTATLGQDCFLSLSTGTTTSAEEISSDGYISVNIGGTDGHIPVFLRRIDS